MGSASTGPVSSVSQSGLSNVETLWAVVALRGLGNSLKESVQQLLTFFPSCRWKHPFDRRMCTSYTVHVQVQYIMPPMHRAN